MLERGLSKWGGLWVVLASVVIAAPACKQPTTDDAKKDDKSSKDDKDKSKDTKKKGGDDDDDDDDKGAAKKKKKGDDDDDDDDKSASKKKKKAGDDDDDDDKTAAKKKKKPAAGDDDDDDDAPAIKKKKPAGDGSSDGINIAGTFTVKGAAPDGKPYGGTGTISKIGGEMYNVLWVLGGINYKGIAFRDGDVLSCGWAEAKAGGDSSRDLGVIAYLVKDDGQTLDGVWFEPDETSLGKELLSGGSSNLTGFYKITDGEQPTTKKKYTGSVTIGLKNGVYNLTWNFGGALSKGLGIRSGDVLSAAFSDQGGQFGVLQYRISAGGSTLSGQWVQSGQTSTGVGTETMTKL